MRVRGVDANQHIVLVIFSTCGCSSCSAPFRTAAGFVHFRRFGQFCDLRPQTRASKFAATSAYSRTRKASCDPTRADEPHVKSSMKAAPAGADTPTRAWHELPQQRSSCICHRIQRFPLSVSVHPARSPSSGIHRLAVRPPDAQQPRMPMETSVPECTITCAWVVSTRATQPSPPEPFQLSLLSPLPGATAGRVRARMKMTASSSMSLKTRFAPP